MYTYVHPWTYIGYVGPPSKRIPNTCQRDTQTWHMVHLCRSHYLFLIWFTYVGDMTHLCECHDVWFIYVTHITYFRCDLLMWVTWLIYVSDMPHLVWAVCFAWSWRIHMSHVTHVNVNYVTGSYETHHSFMWVTWLIWCGRFVSPHMNTYAHECVTNWMTLLIWEMCDSLQVCHD